MLEIICDHKQTSLNLDPIDNEPICVSLEPYTEDFELILTFKFETSFKAVCLHLKTPNEAFLEPVYASCLSEIPPLSSCIFIRTDDTFILFFCLSHLDQQILLSAHQEGLILHAKSASGTHSKLKRASLLVLAGANIHQLIERAISLKLNLTKGIGKVFKEKVPLPSWLSSLGWGSLSASKETLSHEKVIQAISSLLNGGCILNFVLINEGWQEVENGRLKSFFADKARFPSGLKGLILELKNLGIKHVGVWHAMMGATDGVHSELSRKYHLTNSHEFLGSNLGTTFEFFHDYYASLKAQGVSFIKVGDQSAPNRFSKNEKIKTQEYKNLQTAIQASASIHFNGAHFNTDCCFNENLYYWTTANIARVAVDPDFENSKNLMKTIRNGLCNALWMQYLMLPDFDVWTTTHENSEILSVLHALSGSINVICDFQGLHNNQIIRKMQLPCGKILKADKPLTLCQDSIFLNPINEKKIYKAFTYKGETAMIAAFNLMEEKCTLHGFISPSDIEGLSDGRFALLSHHKGFIGCFNFHDKIEIALKFREADVLTFAPVKAGIAVFGCYNFFLTQGPLVEVTLEENSIHISTLAVSPMMIYCERHVFEVRRNDHTIPWEYNEKRKILTIDSRSSYLNEPSHYSITLV